MYQYDNIIPFDTLKGKTLTEIKNEGDEITFTCSDGDVYVMAHQQDCCENVSVDEIEGDLQDLIGSEILLAEERNNVDVPHGQEYEPESFTWTFYVIRNIKTTVTIKWYGTSNGYYSESVDFWKKVDEEND